MKKIKFILIFSCLISTLYSFSQSWQWAQRFGSGNDVVNAMCRDTQGNIYITGYFHAPLGGNSIAVFGNDTLSSNGTTNIFIAKINDNANFIWSQRAGGYVGNDGGNIGRDIAYDYNSDAIIVLSDIGGTNPFIDSCNLSDGSQTILSKLDVNGNCIWTTYSGVGGISIALENAGNIYLAGANSSVAGFNNGTILQPGFFIAKYNSDGNCIWAKKIREKESSIYPTTIKIKYRNNKIFIAGYSLTDTLKIDTATIYCFPNDIYISQFDTSGNVQWVRTIGGPNDEKFGGFDVDDNSNIYVSGKFKDTAWFNSTMLSNGLKYDWFLAKYNSLGDVLWVKQSFFDTDISSSGGKIVTDSSGNTYATCKFSGSATFGTFSASASQVSNMFIVRYDSNGICYGLKVINNVFASCILSDIGGCYVGGTFKDTVYFDNNSIYSYGNNGGYIAKLDAITGIQPQPRIAGNSQLLIYANPTTGKCNITVPEEFSNEENLMLRIFDNTGKLIQEQKVAFEEEKIKINLEAEAKGVYNVTLGNKSKTYSGKIVFE